MSTYTSLQQSDKSSSKDGKVPVEEPPPGGGKSRAWSFKKYCRNLLCKLHLRKDSSLEESVAELIEEHDADGIPIHPEERTILTNMIGFKQLRVADVMIPRSDIVAISDDISLDDLRKIILDKEHTRMPVYYETLDNIKGFVHTKDLIQFLGADVPFILKQILRDIPVVPTSMLVIDLLMKMRASRVHIALVVDEHGGTDGLVTIEDLVEEIVGEIEDEHDIQNEPVLRQVTEGIWEVNARLPIEKFEREVGAVLASAEDREDYDTMGGLIFSMTGRIPATGEVIDHEAGLQFKILEADPRRIKRILVQKTPAPETAAS